MLSGSSNRQNCIDDLQKILLGHIKPAHFDATERAYFYNIIRKPEESLRDFLLRLQRQASKCNFGSELQTQLRDRIISGVNDLELQKRLLQESGLDFDPAKTIQETWDNINRAISLPAQVLFNKGGKRHKGNKAPPSNFKPSTSAPKFGHSLGSTFKCNQPEQKSGKCNWCGGAHLRSSCKFRNSQCYNCKRLGHIAAVCRASKSNMKVHTVYCIRSAPRFGSIG